MNLTAVAIGGFIGASLRYLVGLWIPPVNHFPLGTLIVNLAGCLFLGWFLTVTVRFWKLPGHIRLGIGTGLAGSFTTFSSFSVQTLHLLQNHQFMTATVYILTSVVGGLILAALGYLAASLLEKTEKWEQRKELS